MSKDELVRRIERFDVPHSRRILEQCSEQRLEEYLVYLLRRRMPSEATMEQIAGAVNSRASREGNRGIGQIRQERTKRKRATVP